MAKRKKPRFHKKGRSFMASLQVYAFRAVAVVGLGALCYVVYHFFSGDEVMKVPVIEAPGYPIRVAVSGGETPNIAPHVEEFMTGLPPSGVGERLLPPTEKPIVEERGAKPGEDSSGQKVVEEEAKKAPGEDALEEKVVEDVITQLKQGVDNKVSSPHGGHKGQETTAALAKETLPKLPQGSEEKKLGISPKNTSFMVQVGPVHPALEPTVQVMELLKKSFPKMKFFIQKENQGKTPRYRLVLKLNSQQQLQQLRGVCSKKGMVVKEISSPSKTSRGK